MNEIDETYYKSDIGFLRISGTDEGIQSVEFTELTVAPHTARADCLVACCRQLDEYFAGERTVFDLRLAPRGTAFQRSVWQQLLEIPYGTTSTYMNVARALGREKAVRAVGAANGRNPIPIIIPCHRVIGSNGALVGFGGGIWRKEFLLRHEGLVLV